MDLLCEGLMERWGTQIREVEMEAIKDGGVAVIGRWQMVAIQSDSIDARSL